MGRVFRRPCEVQFKQHDETANPTAGDDYRDKPRIGADDILISTVWASIIPTRGMEYEQFHSRQSKMRCSITVDYFDGFMPDGSAIDASCYIQYGTRLFDILAVLPDDETKKTVTFTCEEKPSGV